MAYHQAVGQALDLKHAIERLPRLPLGRYDGQIYALIRSSPLISVGVDFGLRAVGISQGFTKIVLTWIRALI